MTQRTLRAGALLAALTMTACQPATGPTSGPTSGPTPGSSSAAEGSASPATSPSATPVPIAELLRLTLDDSGPIIRHGDGPAGSVYALPAAGARVADGTYALIMVWFPTGNGGEPPVIGLATSADGRDWNVGKRPILDSLGVGGTDPGPIPSALVQLDDGTWQLYGWADDPMRSPYFSSWRASAPSLEGPWTLDRDKIVEPGSPGTWDSQTAGIGAVQRTATGFLAWYEGSPPGRSLRGDLGAASSSDGLTWRKHDDPATTAREVAESDPVLRRGMCGGDTSLALFQPQVEVEPDGYAMVFGGFGRSEEQMDLFGAVSEDGLAWTCGTPEALLKASDIPGSQGIHTFTSFPFGDGRIGLILESLGDGSSDIWLAEVEPVD